MNKQQINIPLNDVRHLLLNPDCDPFVDRSLTISGLQYAIRQLRMKQLPEKIELNLWLPDHQQNIDLENVKNSFRTHCLNVMKEKEEDLCYLSWQIKKNFKRAVLPFLLATIAMGWFMYHFMDERSKVVEILIILLNNCIIVLGWVLLWIPAEMYLYDIPRVRREIDLYKLFGAADITLNNRRDRG